MKNNAYTHKGLFHADEAVGTAEMLLANPNLKIHRVNFEELTQDQINHGYILDIGREYNPIMGRFDHHQFDRRNPEHSVLIRKNGIPYATAGLIWQEVGMQLCGFDRDVFERVDKVLIEQIDAHDADSTYYASASASDNEVRLMTLSNVISSFNTENIHNDEAQYEAFTQAVEFAKRIIQNNIEAAKKYVEASRKFDSIITKESEQIIFLPEFVHWKEIVRENYPYVRFVITKSSHIEGEFSLLAVPVHPAKRELIIPIERPEWFTGFIPAGKFIAGCKTYEEALKLAKYNLP